MDRAEKAGEDRFHIVDERAVLPANWGVYASTKHALESIAEALQQELAVHGIKVQTINPGAFYTGFNETMADTAFRWLDDAKNITRRADLRAQFDEALASPLGHLDAQEMIDRMIEIVPADAGSSATSCLWQSKIC